VRSSFNHASGWSRGKNLPKLYPGSQPHAGFPEIKYHEMAEALARAGHRVVVVEQVGGSGASLRFSTRVQLQLLQATCAHDLCWHTRPDTEYQLMVVHMPSCLSLSLLFE
jgi:hypothetical protein